jgi:hypothetical protein
MAAHQMAWRIESVDRRASGATAAGLLVRWQQAHSERLASELEPARPLAQPVRQASPQRELAELAQAVEQLEPERKAQQRPERQTQVPQGRTPVLQVLRASVLEALPGLALRDSALQALLRDAYARL